MGGVFSGHWLEHAVVWCACFLFTMSDHLLLQATNKTIEKQVEHLPSLDTDDFQPSTDELSSDQLECGAINSTSATNLRRTAFIESHPDTLALDYSTNNVMCLTCTHQFSSKTHHSKISQHLNNPLHIFMSSYKDSFNLTKEEYKSKFNLWNVYKEFVNLDSNPKCKVENCTFEFNFQNFNNFSVHLKEAHNLKISKQNNMTLRVNLRPGESKRPVVLFPLGVPGTSKNKSTKFSSDERDTEINRVISKYGKSPIAIEKVLPPYDITFLSCTTCARRFTPYSLDCLESGIARHLKSRTHRRARKGQKRLKRKQRRARRRLARGLPAKVCDGFTSPPKKSNPTGVSHCRLIPDKEKKNIARRTLFAKIPISSSGNVVIQSMIISEVDRSLSITSIYSGIDLLWQGNFTN